MSKRKGNCNVIKLYDQSRDGSNLIGTFQIITDPASQGWLSHQSLDYLTFRIIFPTFGSTFQINLLNQPFELTYAISLFIKLAAPLAYGTSLPLTNVRMWESTSTYGGIYNSDSWLFCRSPTRQGVKCIIFEHPLVVVWMKALLDAAKTSPLCERQLCLQESQNNENDEGLLVVDQWPPGLMST